MIKKIIQIPIIVALFVTPLVAQSKLNLISCVVKQILILIPNYLRKCTKFGLLQTCK